MELKASKSRRNSSSDHTLLCDIVYDFVKLDDGTVEKHSLLDTLSSLGILEDDPRISSLIKSLIYCSKNIPKNVFVTAIANDVDVIEKTLSNAHLIYDFESFRHDIMSIYNDVISNTSGKVSNNIPQLAKQNPSLFGLSVCTVDGQRFHLGDSKKDFLMQSCTKPISYSMALEEHGMNVHRHVGREPSGSRFNTLKVNRDGLPHNPLSNSGTIMVCSLIQQDMLPADRFDYIQKTWTDLSGGKPFGFSNPAYLAERSTNDRNYAIAHFLRENKAFPVSDKIDIDRLLEFVFQCFALVGNTDKLSIVAASLANGGVCPLTGIKIFSPETVKHCLSVMFSCGLCSYSGEFAFTTGLPACAGEAGAMMVVIPGVMGVCTYSPCLDEYGISARGNEFFLKLNQRFNFHMFDHVDKTKSDPCKSLIIKEALSTDKCIRFSSYGDLGALKRLRPSEDDLLSADYDHRTPLHLAASNGHLKVVKYLLDRIGVENINPTDRRSATPYDDALRENHDDVAEFLYDAGGRRGCEIIESESMVDDNEVFLSSITINRRRESRSNVEEGSDG